MDVKDIYLKYYCHIDNEPLKSITQLPEQEALALAIKLRDENPCGAHSRFGSISTFDKAFVDYYSGRKRVEKVLYERFVALGGKPQMTAPCYFFVHDWASFLKNMIMDEINKGAANIMEIRLQDIDIHDVSFVLGDSMAVVDSDEWDGLLLKDTLMEAIVSHNGYENYFNSIKAQYIEAQLWTDEYRHLFRIV